MPKQLFYYTVAVIVIAAMFGFQNCSKVGFEHLEETEVGSIVNQSLSKQSICAVTNQIVLAVTENSEDPFSCVDESTLSNQYSLGLVCPGGVEISEFTVDSTAKSISEAMLCGVSATRTIHDPDTETVSGIGTVHHYRLIFRNLPWGCSARLNCTNRRNPLVLNFSITPPRCGLNNSCLDVQIDGDWTEWQNSGSCSASCGGGLQLQTRTCTNPAPANGGANCSGDSERTVACNTQACGTVTNGGWSGWQDSGTCSATCGGGLQLRVRTCTNPPPANGGADCSGSPTQTVPCNTQACGTVTDGGWSGWQDSGSCSASCGGGLQLRVRTCTNPPPANGGADCSGSSTQTVPCNTQACVTVTNGDWSGWQNSGSCSATCGGGQQLQVRTCTNPPPANGGANCSGDSERTVPCNTQACECEAGQTRTDPTECTGTDIVGNRIEASADTVYSCSDHHWTLVQSGSCSGIAPAYNVCTVTCLVNGGCENCLIGQYVLNELFCQDKLSCHQP